MRYAGTSCKSAPGQRASMPLHVVLLITLLIGAAGCGAEEHADDHGSESAAAHAAEAEERLLFTAGTEWFIEYEPMVSGAASAWNIHLTDLRTGRPVSTDGVVMQVTYGRGSTARVPATPQSPGIYRAEFKPPEPGFLRALLQYETEGRVDSVVVAEVPVYASHEAMHAVSRGEETEGIAFTKEEAWSMDFRTAPVERRRFPSIIKTTGHLLSHPTMEMEVPATASGILQYRNGPIVPGRAVRKDEALAVIAGGAMADDNIDARIADARAELEAARAAHERSALLLEEDVISEKQMQEVTLRFRRAQNAVMALTDNMEADGKYIRAPIAGYVKIVRLQNGAYVRTGDAVLTVARNDRMLLKAELYQSEYAQLGNIHGATFRTDDGRTYDIAELNGALRTRGRAVDASAYSIPVYFEIDGASLLPGEFVDVYLHAGEETPRLVIPVSALTEDLGTFSVYVQRGGERFEKRQVATGPGDGTVVPVLSGLEEGERIVTRGVHAVRLAASAGQVQAHAHEH